jgi:hypothetical protein
MWPPADPIAQGLVEHVDNWRMKIGNVIASTLALCWALAVLIHHFVAGSTAGSGAFHAGQIGGQLFVLALGVAGARGLVKEIQRSRA